jgi:hypothetical protein
VDALQPRHASLAVMAVPDLPPGRLMPRRPV